MPTPLKSYIDRVLNVLAEIDDKGLDKKEIYKELAADGYDRSVVSQVVGHIRKKAAKPGKFAEQSQLFDIYLADYEGVGTVDATHTLHASSDERRPPSDKIEAALRTSERRAKSAGKEKPVDIASPDPSLSKAQGSHEPPTVAESAMVATEPATTAADDGGEGGEDAPALSADTQSQPERSEAPRQIEAGLVAKVEDQSTARTDVRDSTEGIAAPQPLNPEAATTPPAAGRSPVDTHPEPGNGEAGASPAPAPEPAAEGTAHNPIPSAVPGNMQNLHNAPGSIRTERTHTEGAERHQFAVWPEYQGRAHADLVDDVRTNGVREPIVMQGRIILDGWARYLAAREAGVSYPVQEYAGDDPLRDIITLNMASRSLNLVERQSIAKKLTKLAPDRADEIGELLDLQQQREAAQ